MNIIHIEGVIEGMNIASLTKYKRELVESALNNL